jgi:outer membrane protein OmpA-like peptidoglycan-associated protein
MKKAKQRAALAAPWLAYTDLLSSTLMILTVAIVISALARFASQKPPIIRLSDAADYRFETGSYTISPQFKRQLITHQLPEMEKVIRCYGIDTIEIIGHTDSRPNSGAGNLDSFANDKDKILAKGVMSGSNADLGLLRAISVEGLLKRHLQTKYKELNFHSYSASSFVKPENSNKPTHGKTGGDQQAKRRIEVRFTRSEVATSIPRC